MTKNIATALVKAQMNMTKATKGAANPHLRSKYADLGSVMDACVPALNEAGIALLQPAGEDEKGRYVETLLIHGESGEQLSCKIPLIVQKNDMQGYGSAVTYARRYGLMTMAGIAPEDDDGNAATKARPQQQRKPEPVVDQQQEPPERPQATDAEVSAAEAAISGKSDPDMLKAYYLGLPKHVAADSRVVAATNKRKKELTQ